VDKEEHVGIGEIKDFRDLDVWKRCKELRQECWELIRSFPAEERYRLSDQIIRASRSITACIAEGYGRFHYQENIQFCRQSRGSLFELMDHISVARECGYLDDEKEALLINKVKRCIWIVNGYIKHLKNQKTLSPNKK
jgi:four helix bundle protein